jgi:sialate O-acetylesterase
MLAPRFFSLLVVCSFFASTGDSLRADVKLPPFFSDHMVLQRDGKAPIWGTAAAGEKVTVKFRDQTKDATADDKGAWRVELTGLKAGGPDELSVAGTNTITLKDVLVGEVWVGSGQSNMAGTVGTTTTGYAKDDPVLAAMAAKDYPQIRGCGARNGWSVAEAKNNPRFSAILFAFAVRLHQELDVPVGMMLGAVGGTPSGAWLSEAALAADAPSQQQMAKYVEEYPALVKKYEEVDLPRWRAAAEKLKADGKQVGREPPPPSKPGVVRDQKPGYLYEAHIRPFVGYGIRGTLWDQGESGTAVGGVDQYTLMGALINGWRKEWNQGDFTFIYVQKPSGNGCAWDYENPVTNQAQPFTNAPAAVPVDGLYVETHVKIMNYPNTGMAISSDLGPFTHPLNKSGYGSRSAQVALGMAYGKPVEYYGPVYKSHAVDGDKVTITFTHLGQGLATKHGTKLQGFAIAGDDKKFVWADAKIDGDKVVLSSPTVKEPKAVRYAWSQNRTWANLFNKDGLPAVTFRTDSW